MGNFQSRNRSILIAVIGLICVGAFERDSIAADVAVVASPLSVVNAPTDRGLMLQFNPTVYESLKQSERFVVRDFAMPDGTYVNLELERFEIFAADARIVVADESGDHPMERPDVVLLRGTIAGEESSRVYLGLSPHGTNGFLLRGDRKTILAEPPNHAGPIMIYDPASLPAGTFTPSTFTCGMENLPNGGRMTQVADLAETDSGSITPRGTSGCRLVALAVETDFEYTSQVFAGNTTNSAAYIAVLFGAVNQIYTSEVDSRFEIIFSRVWATNSDPYMSSQTVDMRLTEVGNHWASQMQAVPRNIVHMLTGMNTGAGGIAYLGVLCPVPGGYGVSGHLAGSFPNPIQNNVPGNWDLVVVSHEIGHNFNAPHTHDVGIDCCGGGSACGNVVNCSTAAQGTIMSYCHTCAGGIANIALNFHAQIRNNHMLPYLSGAGNCVPFSVDVQVNAQPTPQSADAGDPVLLTINATGGPPLNYQWRKNGQNLTNGGTISGANAATLVISTAAACDAGTYDVVMTSSCSSVTSDAVSVTVDSSGLPAPAEEAKLFDNAAQSASDETGASVSISGDTAMVGAALDDGPAGADQGSAYVHVRSGASWSTQAKLTASDAAAGDRFGSAVSVSGDYAVVGARGASSGAGAAYVFVRSGTVWTQQAKLTANDAAAGDAFGTSAAIYGDTVVVGAPSASSAAGAAYVYVRSGTVWTQQAKITAGDAAAGDEFGVAVALSGNTAVVGAALDDAAAGSDQGSAYVFVRGGTVWSQQAKLTANDAAAGDRYGSSVSLDGDTAIIGAMMDDGAAGADQGGAYLYKRSGVTWSLQSKVTAADAGAGDQFGSGVGVSGENAVVGSHLSNGLAGSDQGAAYLYERCGTGWLQRAKLTPADASATDRFGRAATIDFDTTIVGAPLDDGGAGSDQGGSYIFRQLCPVSAIPLSALSGSICSGQSVDILLSDSQSGVTYQLREGATALGLPVAGTGGAIQLSATLTTATTQTRTFNVLATNTTSGCNSQISQTAQVQVIQTLPAPATALASPNNICVGSTSSIQLTSTGGSGTQLQWFSGSCGGTAVGTGNVLDITPPTVSTTYYARWTGLCGPSSCKSVDVVVNTPVTITQQPSNVAACEGDQATFSTAGSSIPPPIFYQWRRNLTPLSNGGAFSGVNTATLTVNPVTAALAGNYDCLVTSVCDVKGTQVAQLAIPDGPPFFTIPPTEQELCVGQTLTMFGAASGNPSPIYQWKRNGSDIPGATNQFYEVFAAGIGDSGLYELVATNGCYSATSTAVQIGVHPIGNGDGNGDGLVDGRDVAGFVEAILQWDGLYSLAYCAYDMTADDGYVDESDMPLFINAVLAGP
ncbi:MAG: immunoglobulin domain-containing protein [Planctomycetes bacterium]|nr:immunoglobulin domain-containing protein [Planctomycetota bacterium]